MKFAARSRLFRRPLYLYEELGSKTGGELEGPAGDFVKVASTAPS